VFAMKKITASDILELTVSERIQLVEDIWESIVAVPEAVPLTEAQREQIERRLDAYHKNPDAGSPWEIVKQRIRKFCICV
jgi:putative addiction module component (TIGR02574 family)